jgi:hypothetical protein
MFWTNLLLLLSGIATLHGKSAESNRVIIDSFEISTPALVAFIGYHSTSDTQPLESSDIQEIANAWNILQLLPVIDTGFNPPYLSILEPDDGIPIFNVDDSRGLSGDDDVADLCRRSLYVAASSVAVDVDVNNSSTDVFSNSTNSGTVNPENCSANPGQFNSNKSVPSTAQNADQLDGEYSLEQSTNTNQSNTGTATVAAVIHGSERVLQVQEGSTKKLLGRFSFKGFGLCGEKSVLQWNALGVGVRVPISPNFPEYDRNVNLPKIGAFLAVYYPHHYKITISASLTLGSIMFGEFS